MSKSNQFETDILELIFQNLAIANIGDGSGLQPSGVPGNLYVALYTTDPTEADSGTEATFGSYARQAVVRSAAGWNVASGVADNFAIITFPEATSGSETITHIAIRTASSGGDMLFYAPLGTSRLVNTGTTLEFAANAITITED